MEPRWNGSVRIFLRFFFVKQTRFSPFFYPYNLHSGQVPDCQDAQTSNLKNAYDYLLALTRNGGSNCPRHIHPSGRYLRRLQCLSHDLDACIEIEHHEVDEQLRNT